MKITKTTSRIGRITAVSSIATALLLAVAGSPAQAGVSQLWAGAGAAIITDHRTDPPTQMVRLNYDAFVTTDNAYFQIQAGGRLYFSCYGRSSTGGRVFLFGTQHTGLSQYPLVPYGDGMFVNAVFERPRGTLFDVNKQGTDSIWCEATYYDKSYPFTRFFARTGTVSGDY